MPTITVRGTASVPVEPDEAVVALTLAADAERPDAAYAGIAERSQDLERVFQDLGVAPAQRTTAGVSLQPLYEQVENRQELRGYRAAVRTVVRLRESALVARLLEQAVSRAGAQLEGPWWSVDLENPGRLEACRRAAAVARKRAEAYAESLGVQLGVLQSAVEGGASGPQPRFAAMAAIDEVPVSGGEQLVSATVELTFEIA
jgi:uncharacterized protein YggE